MRRRKKKLLVVILAACLAVVVCLLVRFLTSASFLTPRVEGMLARAFDLHPRIDGLDFSFLGGTRAEGIKLYLRREDGIAERPFLELQEVQIGHKPLALLKGKYRAEQIRVGKAKAAVTPEVLAWADMLRGKTSGSEGMRQWPFIAIEGGEVRFDLPPMSETLQAERLRCQLAQDQAGRLQGSLRFTVNSDPFHLLVTAAPSEHYVALRLETPGTRLEKLPRLNPKGTLVPLGEMTYSGQLSGWVSVEYGANAGAGSSWAGDLTFDRLNIYHPRWPGPVGGLAGLPDDAHWSHPHDRLDGGHRSAGLGGGAADIRSAGLPA